jgi:predicted metal-binding membrane protein
MARRTDEEPLPRESVIERVLHSDRLAALVILVVVPLVSWAWIVAMARDMYGPMTGASAWMMTSDWDGRHLLLLWTMWAVMMTGMMLPSAAPLVLVYGGAARRTAGGRASSQVYALAAGYLAVWTLFSLVATGVQRALGAVLLLSPMMELTTPIAGALVLLMAGLYQVTPIKRACLAACQSPIGFLMSHWREGVPGAFRLGLEHGAYCLGCCWALMALLFVGGVMNLAVIAGLTAFVALEKLGLFGRHGSVVSGVALIGCAIWMGTGVL